MSVPRSSATTPWSSAAISDDEDSGVEIIDVPLSARLRVRPPPKEKPKRDDIDEDDDDPEYDEDEDDGNEDDVSDFELKPEGYDDDDYQHSRRRTSEYAHQKGGGRAVRKAEVDGLKAVIGAHVSTANCIQLIKKAQYDLSRAANAFYAQTQDDEDDGAEAKQQPPTSQPPTQGRWARRSLPGNLLNPLSTPASRVSFASTSSPSSSSASPSFPSVRKPGAVASGSSALGSAISDSDSDASSDSEQFRRRRRRAPGGGGWRGRGRGGMMKKGKGRGASFDPDMPASDFHSRPADSALPSAQRMSTYTEGQLVDAKIAGHWFPAKVLSVHEVSHVVRVNHVDWPVACAVYIDPATNRIAKYSSKAAEYYKYEQVQTFNTAPPKPPHPDLRLYRWPGVADASDDTVDVTLFLGQLQARVVSDRTVGAKEFYDTLVCASDNEEAQRVWRLMETWLKRQNKLIVVEEDVKEVLERGQPTPAPSSKAGRSVQSRLHRSFSWRLAERWIKLGYDVREIARSHHRVPAITHTPTHPHTHTALLCRRYAHTPPSVRTLSGRR